MILYRLASPEHINKLDGKGAEKYGQRWNPQGVPALYTATSASLAFVEKLANHSPADFPDDLMLATIELRSNPFEPGNLPSGWSNLSSFLQSQAFGGKLLDRRLAFSIPSVVIPYDRNVVISPLHKSFASFVELKKMEPFEIDLRIMAYLQGRVRLYQS